MRKLIHAAVVTALVLAVGMPPAQAKVCTEHDAVAADAMVDRLDSWSKVDEAYTRYGHCDDGEIADGNAEAIARLLVDHWQSLPQLNALIQRNARLKDFVVRHVNSTLDTGDLEKIEQLSTSSCPADASVLCDALAKAAARSEHCGASSDTRACK